MENEIKNDQVTVVTKEKEKKAKKPFSWKTFLGGAGVGAVLTIAAATVATMLGGDGNDGGSGD